LTFQIDPIRIDYENGIASNSGGRKPCFATEKNNDEPNNKQFEPLISQFQLFPTITRKIAPECGTIGPITVRWSLATPLPARPAILNPIEPF
jgi:hypothetical protein